MHTIQLYHGVANHPWSQHWLDRTLKENTDKRNQDTQGQNFDKLQPGNTDTLPARKTKGKSVSIQQYQSEIILKKPTHPKKKPNSKYRSKSSSLISLSVNENSFKSPKTIQISTRAPQNKTKNNNLRDHKETQKFKEWYSKIIGTWGEQHARANLGTAQKYIKEINFPARFNGH